MTAVDAPAAIAFTAHGQMRGVIDHDVAVFKGIRFAAAARFRPPVRTGPWDGVLDATSYRAQAHQSLGAMEQMFGASSIPMDEDCLHLNVFTPAPDDAKRPVLVWMHGGAYLTGAGSVPWYHGSALVRRGDVVVVTINYRLGAFGFTDLSVLAGGEAFPTSANLGTQDQIAALQWVCDHIEAFGGDPDNVTIFGESAGGSSVVALMAAPAASGLFHAAMAMSPSITQLRSADRAGEASLNLLAQVAGADHVDDLVALSADELLAAQTAAIAANPAASFDAFSPWDDGAVLPKGHIDVAAAANPVPLVVGTTKDENRLFSAFDPAIAGLQLDGLVRRLTRVFPADGERIIDRYRTQFPDFSAGHLASAIATDVTFRVPARRLADNRSATADTWMYWFTFESPAFGGVLASCHALDVPFVFHNLDRPGAEMFTGTSPERSTVADALADAVIGLARTRDPGWTRYESSSRPTQRIDARSETLSDPQPRLRELWASIDTRGVRL